jgi:nucleoside-diphosphate-sugar epimerase
MCREAALGGEQGASRSVHSVGGENSAREIMKVGLLGITGGVGQRFAKLALDRGHTVVAMARTPAKVTLKHPCLIVIKGDSTSLEAVSDFAAGEAGGQPAAANLHA